MMLMLMMMMMMMLMMMIMMMVMIFSVFSILFILGTSARKVDTPVVKRGNGQPAIYDLYIPIDTSVYTCR